MKINSIINQLNEIKKINNYNLIIYTLISQYIDLYNNEINSEIIKKIKKEI